jgi:ABC-2 type transport system ATP-binding protein
MPSLSNENSHTVPALEAQDLSKQFGKVLALEGLTLKVMPGEIFCLLGANGAGKTTTVNLFLNFLRPTAGFARIFGLDVSSQTREARSKVTYLPEQVALYPELSGLENLRYFLSLCGQAGLDREAATRFLLQAGLQEDQHDELVGGYSKGMRQKVGVALALAKSSEVLLLDEPTSGLDPASANEFCHIVTTLAERGAAVFMVTHDIHRAHQIAHRIGIMKKGKLVEDRATSDLEADALESLYLKHMRN